MGVYQCVVLKTCSVTEAALADERASGSLGGGVPKQQ